MEGVKRGLLLVLALFLVVFVMESESVDAKKYYVDIEDSSCNDGQKTSNSESNPWCSIRHAASQY